MKNLLFVLSLMALGTVLKAQDDGWINRTNFITTDHCVDSVTCYTLVVVDVNLATVPDSAQVQFNIGSTFGAGDIYSSKIVNAPSMFDLPNVSKDSLGNASVTLGEFIIGENFFVDVVIE